MCSAARSLRLRAARRAAGASARRCCAGSHVRAGCLRVCGAPLERASFLLAGAAPYAGVLAALERPSQAGRANRATPAHLLGLFYLQEGGARVPDRKEQLRIHVTAGGVVAPVHAVYSSNLTGEPPVAPRAVWMLVNSFTRQGSVKRALALRRAYATSKSATANCHVSNGATRVPQLPLSVRAWRRDSDAPCLASISSLSKAYDQAQAISAKVPS